MNYIDTRSEKIREIHSIYSKDISDFLCNLADFSELSRIKDISKNEGVELSKFNTFQYKYSRMDHAFGTAIILENFKRDENYLFEAIFHEIAKPSFEYSVDYLIDYFKVKDFKKPDAYDYMLKSESLFNSILTDNVKLIDFKASRKSSLGFAEFPKLSADTLEFILSNCYFTNTCDLMEIADIYNNLSIDENDEEEFEFAFSDISTANMFCRLSMEIGKKCRSYEAKITKQLISDVLMLMIRREEISIEDLYKFSDKEIVLKGKSSSDKRIRDGWEKIESLNKVYTRFTPTTGKDKYCVKVNTPSIYVDPLVKTKVGAFRLSSLDSNIEHEIERYLYTDTDMYMYIDYEL